MKVETWLPIFSGFYETVFDMNDEMVSENLSEQGADDLEIEEFWSSRYYYGVVWKEYKANVVASCAQAIESELKARDLIKSIAVDGLQSPREYNFVNDSINITVDFSVDNLKAVERYLAEHADKWSEYIKRGYTSCSGFVSFHSNDSKDWELAESITDSHKAGEILQFILRNEGYKVLDLYYDTEVYPYADLELLRAELLESGYYKDKKEMLARLAEQKFQRELERDNLKLDFKGVK